MPASGNLVRNKLHSHNLAYNRSFFFHATPAQLGLDTNNLALGVPDVGCNGGSGACIPKPLSQTGFKDFKSVEEFIFQKLASAQKNVDGTRPKLVCESTGARKKIRDPASGKLFHYDRRAPVCCKPWQFTQNDAFTVVAFINKVTEPLGPWEPNVVPKSTDMHIHWVMSYDEHRNASFYRCNTVVAPAQIAQYQRSMDKNKLSFLQTSSPSTDKRSEYAQIFGALMVFMLGGYMAHKCSSSSQALTTPAIVCAKCCQPLPPLLKTRYVQYHTV